ncbi:MAG: hypothetical protein ABI870_08320 [Rhodanobacter sp.]
MSRITYRQYQRQVMLTMIVYVVVLLTAFPLGRTVTSLPLKWVLALAPAVPVTYVIWLMARRIRSSDELEQRTHLVALGTATAVVGVLSLVGGFLASAQVWQPGGSILVWVFPVLMICYSITRWWVMRAYGSNLGCSEDENGMPKYQQMLLLAAIFGLMALIGGRQLGEYRLAFLLGACLPLMIAGLVFGVLRWRRRRRPDALP